MIKKISRGLLVCLSACSIFFGISQVNAVATTATISWSGNASVVKGQEIVLNILASNIQGDNDAALMTVGGKITVTDESCLSFVKVEKLAPGTANKNVFAYSDMDGTRSDLALAKATFKASNSACSTTINITEPKLGFTDSTKLSPPTISKTITVVAPSSDADLKSLVPGAGTLSPAFNKGVTEYTVSGVPHNAGSINFNVAVNDPKAGVTSGRTCTLSNKTTTCNIVVRAEDGTTKTYKVVVTKDDAPPSNDATLKSLTPSVGSLSPAFNRDVTNYTINNVNMSVNQIDFNAVVNDSKSTVTGTSCTLSGMSNTCNIEVTAEDGTKKTYTIQVNKKEPDPTKSSDATLKNLEADGYSLTPAFDKDTNKYTIFDVPRDVTTIQFQATPNDTKATVSGTNCNLDGDETSCSIQVTAEDGSSKTYEVVVKKKEEVDSRSDDATLKSLDLGGQGLNPEFSSDNTNYTFTVENNVTSLEVHAIPNHENATVTISGQSDWKEGINPVYIRVTAENGSEKTYVVNVYRKPLNKPSGGSAPSKSSNNYLENIIINNGELVPGFDKNNNNYTVNVPNDVTTLDIKAFGEDGKSNVVISGHENLKDGMNVVTVTVTAEDGSVRIYTINVYRSKKVSQNKLKNLIVANGEMVGSFDSNVFEYEINVVGKVNKLDLTAIPEFDSSIVEIMGNDNLQDGTNAILIKVTDENGFVQYYRLTVHKTSVKTFLGLTLGQWLLLLGALFLIGFLIFLLFLILKRMNKDKEPVQAPPVPPVDSKSPVIEFKPEFNFGSKNGTDDDVVEAGGVLNQYTGIEPKEAPKVLEAKEMTPDATYSEIPYDPYDETITKDEMYDALQEAMKTKDTSKLKMLYEQERLNRKKKELKRKEEERQKYQNGFDED